MKTADAALVALIGTGSFVSADLYSITLSDASILRYTNAQVDIQSAIDIFAAADVFALADIFLAYTWSSRGPRIDDPNGRARARWRTGLDVDTWQVRVTPRTLDPVTLVTYPDKIGTTAWLAAAAGGALDGATVKVERAFLAAWPTPWATPVAAWAAGTITIFLGRMAQLDVGRSYAILNINDFRELLTMQMPRNLYQSGCRFTLFGAGCSLSAAAFAVAGTVIAVNANGNEITTVLPFAAGYFNLGTLVMTSGVNTGFRRTVRSWDGNILKLIAPFYFSLAAGSTFTVYPGCDKRLTTCTTRFANSVNFGGTDLIPAPETAI